MAKLCWVELQNRQPVRIFRNRRTALCTEWERADVELMDRSEAVRAIRQQVIKRANGDCEKCGKHVGTNGHLHEKIPRGKSGEVSLENSILLCADCHIGDNNYSAHSNRRLQSSKIKD